jgi:hypothetical protein
MAESDLLNDIQESYRTLLLSSPTAKHCVGLPEALVQALAVFEVLPDEFSISFFFRTRHHSGLVTILPRLLRTPHN